ncbi:hypothetical protein [Vitiosangium sp. GDMCC 1.1324]|uniref:hypothetical protein n=1 Tax=Vitiosangium sp. (strain GDMCC 1.1324) TaxID=2138576 RepID=UPI000D34D7BF|nr:hypothetical protein [Vitiosangium sp. GDMCC 1.1324]PTL76762.1 hypothetical protein DAT35_48415 [Vitiosangium sp. GDMCC 1.1324]
MSTIDRSRNLLQTVRTGTQNAVEKTAQTVSPIANTVSGSASKAGQFVDGFESKGTSKAKGLLGGIFGGSKPDKVFDGQLVGAGGKTFPPGTPLSQIPGVTPRNNPNPTQTFVYVNGISNTKDDQFNSMQQIADRTGAKVVGVHNATEGMIADLAQCVKDKLDKGSNPAVDTLADTVYSELKAGRSVHLFAHSQGALVTSRALNDVANRLRIEDGMSKADVEKALGKVDVETFGGAAAHFPDGPKYVHYVNNKDIVPTWFGQGNGKGVDEWARNGGKGAVVHRFDYGSGINGTHSLNDAYLSHRVPFDQARAGKFE